MFLEYTGTVAQSFGWIEVICGSMFSGKTEELLRRVRRARIASQRVELFKPEVDNRYSEEAVVSHDSSSAPSTVVNSPGNILILAQEARVVAIDEGQFFDDSLVQVCTQLAAMGKRVMVAGLDMDYRGRPFGPMPALMSVAEYVTKVHAICIRCGALANHSHRLDNETSIVAIGQHQRYEPLCRGCFTSALSTPPASIASK